MLVLLHYLFSAGLSVVGSILLCWPFYSTFSLLVLLLLLGVRAPFFLSMLLTARFIRGMGAILFGGSRANLPNVPSNGSRSLATVLFWEQSSTKKIPFCVQSYFNLYLIGLYMFFLKVYNNFCNTKLKIGFFKISIRQILLWIRILREIFTFFSVYFV